jgi:UDP-3-O-[3-hydroxymyristoyl] glucosamine N-acyltransferase
MIKVSEIAHFLGVTLLSKQKDFIIRSVAPLSHASSGALCFCNYPIEQGIDILAAREAEACIIPTAWKDSPRLNELSSKHLLLSDYPRLHFIRVVNRFFTPQEEASIHETALIHPTASYGTNLHVGAYSVIGPHVTIGNDCRIDSGVHIYADTKIADRVLIQSGSIIGTPGFGYERNEVGTLERFPHLGNVVIESDVEIGSNVSIDRGALASTLIGEGSKIDNLVHVAHNVTIGKHSMLIAHAMIGGSTTIKDRVWIAPSSAIRDHITIENDAFVGLASVVTKDVPEGVTVVGSPARDLESFKKMQKSLKA